MRSGLPIDAGLAELAQALSGGRSVVLQAPPGAGKSTVVPLALLEQPWCKGKRIIMLQPRRLAARAVANRMAQTLGESVGRTVGYRMRMDSRVSAGTRIEVVTEGVLTRMLQADPAAENVAALIFDEFHERSLQADLGLALALDARDLLSPELKIVIMSATLDVAAVAGLLGGAPVISVPGRLYPIATRFVGRGAPPLPVPTSLPDRADSPEAVMARAVLTALREEPGDVLVFLPGVREIRRVGGLLESSGVDPSVRILELYGELPAEEQDAALLPPPAGYRKVILATNLAETSLTIEGVRVVVDSGLVRRSVFDPVTGMSRLETQRISRASADQRRGRAGRREPGVCYRLWAESAQRGLAAFTPPEILGADLAPLALELAAWGAREGSGLHWLDPPPPAMLSSARDLLSRLGALDSSGLATAHGRRMADLGLHPRWSHMLLRGAQLGCARLAADLVALLSERDLLNSREVARDADIRSRLALLQEQESGERAADRARLQRARRISSDLIRKLGADAAPSSGDQAARCSAGVLLAFAYPDRVALRRAGADGRYTLANGRGAYFAEPQSLALQELIVAIELDDRAREARILLAAPLPREELFRELGARLTRSESIRWSADEQAVIARRFVKLDEIVLEEKPVADVPQETSRTAMLDGIRQMGIGALPWDREARDLQARIEFLRREDSHGGWPTSSDQELECSLDNWLAPYLYGITRREHLTRLALPEILRERLSWEQRRRLDELAPAKLRVPSGSEVRIDYGGDNSPSVSVRLQEVFGLQQTPRVAGGRVPVTFVLLSPAQRPVQITRDLASFWREAYAEVRKDLRGRYPRHHWPEDPLAAAAVRGVRRRT